MQNAPLGTTEPSNEEIVLMLGEILPLRDFRASAIFNQSSIRISEYNFIKEYKSKNENLIHIYYSKEPSQRRKHIKILKWDSKLAELYFILYPDDIDFQRRVFYKLLPIP